MQILLFDMDGVLIEPNGYHLALRETVRLASRALGFESYYLSPEMIARFESLGITNEWHSSALCTALMLMEGQEEGFPKSLPEQAITPDSAPRPLNLDLGPLLALIEEEPLDVQPLDRAQRAINRLASRRSLDPGLALDVLGSSESLDRSLTLNLFQELILGSAVYAKTYDKAPQLMVESYLEQFDRPLLTPALRQELLRRLGPTGRGAAIMTNRPSAAFLGSGGTPEAELAVRMVGLDSLPLVGTGEMTWLADRLGRHHSELQKPAPYHALAALLAAVGMPVSEALLASGQIIDGGLDLPLGRLAGSEVHVFEDTPGGLLALDRAGELLNDLDVTIRIRKIGLAEDPIKRRALEKVGAEVYASIGEALGTVLQL